MKNKRIMSAAMAVLMAGSLAACGGSASSTADSTAAESTSTAASTEATAESTDEPVTIRITWWGGQTRHDLTQQVLDLYTSEHPNVTFEAVPSGWDGYFEKLATDTATGGMPDIVQMDYMYISTYAQNGSLADLSEYINNGTIDASGIDEALMNASNIGGKTVGIPLSTSLVAFTYNPSVLEEAGVDVPTDLGRLRHRRQDGEGKDRQVRYVHLPGHRYQPVQLLGARLRREAVRRRQQEPGLR